MGKVVITAVDLHKAYGAQAVLDGAQVEIRDDHRLAVIGRNGAGKSTFCRILLGQETADRGSISIARDCRIAHIDQHDDFAADETVLAFLQRRSGRPDWRCGELAARFAIGNDLLATPILSLSGGWRTRAKLCAMLLAEPTFLVLDEPTNFLDTATQLLFERFLASFRGGFLVVSHDREFLRRTTTSTMEVSRGTIALHDDKVDAWLAHKEAVRAEAERFNANQEAKRRHLEDFVARNRARASTAARAQSKQRLLDKLEDREVQLEEALPAIRLPPIETRPGAALRVEGLAIGYPGKRVASGIDLEIERGRKVAVLGDNGQGKTTLIRTLAGDLPAQGGSVRWGYGVRLGLFAQHVYGALDPALTVQQHLRKAAGASPRQITDQQILDLAGAFLFRGDDTAKPAGVLSGGERARLCLAGLLLGGYECLLLDEPTNHLDVETLEALASGLKQHNGTVILISHDRSFVAAVADHIVEVRQGAVLTVPDGYAAYLWRQQQQAEAVDKAVDAKADAAKARGTGRTTRPAASAAEQVIAQARAGLSAAERRVADLEAEHARLIAKLDLAYDDDTAQRLADLGSEQAAAEAEFFAAGEALAAAESAASARTS